MHVWGRGRAPLSVTTSLFSPSSVCFGGFILLYVGRRTHGKGNHKKGIL